jgi:hypothetical protein
MARRLKHAVQATLWQGVWGKLCAIFLALAAVAPAAPAEVVAWLHGIFPGVPSWIVLAVAAGVLVARVSMMRRAVGRRRR